MSVTDRVAPVTNAANNFYQESLTGEDSTLTTLKDLSSPIIPEDGSVIETLIAIVALTILPPQVKSILPDLLIDCEEPHFFETKYGISSSRTYRTLVVKFSEHSQGILTNEKLMKTLQKMEESGFCVPSEKLFELKENVDCEWIARYKNVKIKICVKPQQQVWSGRAPKLLKNVPFEAAFKASLAEARE